MPNTIDQKIAEIAGDDEEYKTTLKNHLANALGYANFKKQYEGMPKASSPEYLTRMGKGVEPKFKGTPGGNAASANAGINLVDQERSYLESLTAKAKSAADTQVGVAAEAQNNRKLLIEGIGNGDIISATFQKMVENPVNPDGTFMTPEQMKTGLTELYVTEGYHNQAEAEKAAAEMVNKYIQDQEGFQREYYLALGATKAEADSLMKADRYNSGQMSEAEAKLQMMIDPTFAKSVNSFSSNPQAQQELLKISSGNSEIGSYEEFTRAFPGISPDAAKPYFQKSAQDDVFTLAEQNGVTPISTNPDTGQPEAVSFSEFVANARTKDLITTLTTGVYNGILTTAEMQSILFQYYEAKKRQAGINNWVAPAEEF